MNRLLSLALALVLIPAASWASEDNNQGTLSIVNGTPVETSAWEALVALETDNNISALKNLRELDPEVNTDTFTSDINYARKVLSKNYPPTFWQQNNILEIYTDDNVKEEQQKIEKALNGQLPIDHFCGGTLIDPYWVLTATHCGVSKDDSVVNIKSREGDKALRVEVDEVISHPMYKIKDEHLENNSEIVNYSTWDATLVRLKTPVTDVEPMSLTPSNSPLPRSGLAYIAGWGGAFWDSIDQTYYPDPQNRLLEAQIPINAFDYCDNTDSMICAEKEQMDVNKPSLQGSCFGDSGGPLVIPDENGKKIQYGIVSYGVKRSLGSFIGTNDCGHLPTNYTSISVIKPWILTVIGKRSPHEIPSEITDLNSAENQLFIPLNRGEEVDTTALSIALARYRLSLQPREKRLIDGIVLANNKNPADALASGVLQDSKLLFLVDQEDLDLDILAELQSIGLRDITILGGVKAISPLVQSRLLSNGFRVNRIAGNTRIETARLIAESRQYAYPKVHNVFVSRAFGTEEDPSAMTADSLALGAVAAMEHTPIMLSPTQELTNETSRWYQFSGFTSASIVGGTKALSTQVETGLSKLFPNKVQRISGHSRVETAIELSKRVREPSAITFIDAGHKDAWKVSFLLAGIAKDFNSKIILTDDNGLSDTSQKYIETITDLNNDHMIICATSSQTCSVAKDLIADNYGR